MMLVGDIGGTNARFAFVDESKPGEFQDLQVLKSGDYIDFSSLLSDYLKVNKKVQRACFAVAGPVIEGKSKVTNLLWSMDAKEIEKAFGIANVHLINDLEAEAYAIDVLPKKDILTLNPGRILAGNRALISPGTGLGEAGIFWDGHNHHPFACEGGHADFAPLSEIQMEFSLYLLKKFGHPSTERALSGPGLLNIFHFLKEEKKMEVTAVLEKEMQNMDASAVITKRAIEKKDSICIESLHLFLTIFGQEASNLALKFLSLGGVYIGGGIVRQILPQMRENLFLSSFLNKGRFHSFLSNIPIYILNNHFSPLYGAVQYLKR